MVRAESIAKGLANYMDAEILPKMGGWQRWVIGSFSGIALKRVDTIITALANHPIAKMLGLINAEGLVDLEVLHEELSKQAAKGPAVIAIPMIGDLRLTSEDVDYLYRAIMSADGQ